MLAGCDKYAVSADYLSVESRPKEVAATEELYDSCVKEFSPARDRLASAYESDSDRRRDLIQDVHAALWLSLRSYDRRCSLRTWVYRVAHNTGASYVSRCMRNPARNWVNLDLAEAVPAQGHPEDTASQRIDAGKLLDLVQRLQPIDRQIFLLYLEGMDSGTVSEITGLSATNVTTKIHRIKKLLTAKFKKGGDNALGQVGRGDADGMAIARDTFQPVCVKPTC